eukprot:Skav226124  [mRNA]  locus=scaffold1047:222584:222985:+ [translate_table: standard]
MLALGRSLRRFFPWKSFDVDPHQPPEEFLAARLLARRGAAHDVIILGEVSHSWRFPYGGKPYLQLWLLYPTSWTNHGHRLNQQNKAGDWSPHLLWIRGGATVADFRLLDMKRSPHMRRSPRFSSRCCSGLQAG